MACRACRACRGGWMAEQCKVRGCIFAAVFEGYCYSHVFMAEPIEEDLSEAERTVKDIFQSIRTVSLQCSEDGTTADDHLHVTGRRDISTRWNKARRKDIAERRLRSPKLQARKVYYEQIRAAISLIKAVRKAEHYKRLAAIPRKWGPWRDPAARLNVNQFVDLPIPEGVVYKKWSQELAVNLIRSHLTARTQFSIRRFDETTVRIYKIAEWPNFVKLSNSAKESPIAHG